MEKIFSVGNTGEMDGTTTQQELSQSLETVSETSATMEPCYPASVSQAVVAQSPIITSYNPFSIERILHQGPPPAARPWSRDVEDCSWNEVMMSRTHHPSISYQHMSQSAWSCDWHARANYVGTTTHLQFAYPAANIHATGEIILYLL